MKLIIITAVSAFEKQIMDILHKNQVHSFSYFPVNGYRNSSGESLQNNWFGSAFHKVESFMFFVFVNATQAENVFRSVEALNESCGLESRIHLILNNIEKYT